MIVNVEVILLGLGCGITLLSYMIAINAHGPTRLILSYLIATIMLAGNVWAIVEYVNTGLDAKNSQVLQQRLEAEKKLADERIQVQEEVYKQNLEKMNFASKLTAYISRGTVLANSMINVNLLDKSLEMEGLMGRAVEMKRKVDEFKNEFSTVSANSNSFAEPVKTIGEALLLLGEAANYYRLFYHSEDSDQEAQRENIMRQKARLASEKFQSANSSILSK
jgi:hypothetical protein